MVFERLFKGRRQRRPAEVLYEAVVAQARCPAFYTDYGVPDGFEQRFDMLVLHAHLVIRRLSGAGAGAFAQELFDTLFFDMDRTLRAMGVGDMSVGKRIKDMVRAFYGRTAAYDEALADARESVLADALARNVYGGASDGDRAARLARYVRSTVAVLGRQAPADLAGGRVDFPDPGAES